MKVLQSLLGGQMTMMGLIVFVLVTWFSGEYSQFMRTWRPLIIVAGAILFFIFLIIQKMMARKSAAAIEERLQSQAQEQLATARPDRKPQVQALQKQLSEAIASLKASKMGTGALYTLPWYIIIGPPGSGKSTALQESGLNFPYMSQGRKGIRGVGGTRNCDWWFTDQGILLDTAGRYTTELEDRDEWLSFLDMLKKCRKRKPINGAIVCVSVADMVQCSDEERESHVKNIRDRIDELTKRLEQVFPVYLVFTKCDLLNGFVDFFEDFGKADRAQVWGFTLPYSGKVESYQAVFDEEIRKLHGQLSAQRVTALAAERPMDKKRRIFGFPLQFAMAHRKLAEFVGELFRPNPFQESSILRGIYFTSGTQEGTPIDQLVSAMGGAFGLQEDAAGLLSQAVDRKSYFINTLFSRVIFGDQNLARSSTRVARRRTFARAAMAAGSVVALIVFSVSLTIAFFGNLRLMKSVGGTARKLQEAEQSRDLAGNLRALEDLRVWIERLEGYTSDNLPMSLRWGLYRGREVYLGRDGKSGIRKVYVDSINSMFVKNLGRTLEEELRVLASNRNKKDREFNQLFELLQVYQMIGKDPDPSKKRMAPERDLITAVLKENDRWLKTLGPEALAFSDDLKQMAAVQRDFFVDQVVKGATWEHITLPDIDIDGKLVKEVVVDLQEGLWITETFQNILTQAGDRYPPVSVDSLLGSVPGKDLFECPAEFHVQGAFTSEALDRYIRSAIKEKSESFSAKLKKIEVDKAPSAIASTLMEMHEREHLRQWERFFKNISLRNFDDLKDAAAKLKILTTWTKDKDTSPYQKLFKEIWEGRAIVPSGKTADDRSWLNDALQALEELQRGLSKLTTLWPKGERFISRETPELKELSNLLDNCKGKMEGATKKADPALADAAARVLNRSLQSTLEAFINEAQAEAETFWSRNVHQFYAAKLDGKHPLVPGASEEIQMRTFSEFFNPKSGIFWKSLERLNRLRDGFKFEGQSLVRVSTDFDECVKKAALFRDALYQNANSEIIEVPLTLTFGLRSAVAEVVLWIGGKRLSSDDDPTMTVSLIWSEANPKGVKLEIKHDVRGDEASRTSNEQNAGYDWGLLRLFGDAVPKGDSERRFEISWKFIVVQSGEKVPRYADCTLEVQKRETPFAPKFFEDFKVPARMAP